MCFDLGSLYNGVGNQWLPLAVHQGRDWESINVKRKTNHIPHWRRSIWKEEDNKNSIKNYGFIRLLRKWLDVKWSCTILNYKRCYFSNFTSWQVQTLVVCGWGFKSNINYSLSEAWFLLVLFKYYKPIDNIVHITRVGNDMKISKKPSPKGTFTAHPVKL